MNIMPAYSLSDIKHIIDADEFKALFNHAVNNRDKVYVTILWFTGARPAELQELKKKDIVIEPERISFHIITKKLKNDGRFVVEKRTLVLKMSSDVRYVQAIQKHLRRLQDDSFVFQFSKRTGENIIQRLGYSVLGFSICPYNFRHSRMTLLAEKGASLERLMHFKGSRSQQSVRSYIHARKIEYEVEEDIDL